MGWKCRIRLCQNLKFRFLKNWVSGKYEIETSKLEIRFQFWNLGIQNSKIYPQNSKICTSKPEIRFSILNFGDRNSKSTSKTQNFGFKKWENRTSQFWKKCKIGTSKPEIRFRFWFLAPKIHFQKSKINFSNSSRISFREPKIRIQRCRKPINLHFRFKIHIFASKFSSTKILILY